MLNNACCVWITGLPTSGKSVLAERLAVALRRRGQMADVIDSGKLRRTPLGSSLGFSKEERDINVRRHALAALLLTRHSVVAVVSAVSPYQDTREEVRKQFERFLEVYVSTPKAACIERDTRGVWARAVAGEIRGFTGVDAVYEPPPHPDVEVDLSQISEDAAVERVLRHLEARCWIPEAPAVPFEEPSIIRRRLRTLGYDS